jgi:hypothetical protein
MKPYLFQLLLVPADKDGHGLERRDILEHLGPELLEGGEGAGRGRARRRNARRDGKGRGKRGCFGTTDRGRKALAAEAERRERYVQATRVCFFTPDVFS